MEVLQCRAIVRKCTIMHKLMCVIFSSNCVKSTIFFILHNYGRADVIALITKNASHPVLHYYYSKFCKKLQYSLPMLSTVVVLICLFIIFYSTPISFL